MKGQLLTGEADILAAEASRLFFTDSLAAPSLWDLSLSGTDMLTRAVKLQNFLHILTTK